MGQPRLSDEQVWALIHDAGRTPAATLAAAYGVTEFAICHRRRALRAGWSCPLHWSVCPVCGQPSAAQGRSSGPHPHPWCRREHRRRSAADQRARNRARGVTSTAHVRRWRERHPERAAALRERERPGQRRYWQSLPPEAQASMLERAHEADADAYERTRHTAHQSGARWTADEDARIIAELDRPAADLAAELGRTSWAVRSRRTALRKRGLIDDRSRPQATHK